MKLDILSSVDSKKFPELFAWDTVYRSNHAFYQQKIDEIAFHLQKSQRSWLALGKFALPGLFYQRDLILLELYKRKQQVGRISPEEVQSYKPLNPNIVSDLSKTFDSKYHIPFVGLGAGVGSFIVTHIFNFQYSLRTGIFLLPVFADVLYHWTDRRCYFRSIEFLDYLAEYRKARCRLEWDAERVDTSKVRSLKLQGTLDENWEKVVSLAKEEKGQWKEE